MEMAKQRVIVDDAVIESGEIQEIIDPLWWSVSIYDGEEQYQRDLEGFTAPQRYLFSLQWYLAEVNNGGHDQFYSNSTGIVWEDAMNGAREMGMEELYGIIRESADRMGGKPAKEREDRWDQMSELEPEFGDLNKRLYAMEKADDIERRMAAYALETRQALYSYQLAFPFPTDAGALNYLRGRVFTVADVPFRDKYFPAPEAP